MIKKPFVSLLAAGCFVSAVSAHANWLERLSPKKWVQSARTAPKAGKAARTESLGVALLFGGAGRTLFR